MYFEIIFSNGYCGCDEYEYIEADSEKAAEEYAAEYLIDGYSFYDDPSQCLADMEDYDSEEEYWEAVEEYQADCGYVIREISKEEYEEYTNLE